MLPALLPRDPGLCQTISKKPQNKENEGKNYELLQKQRSSKTNVQYPMNWLFMYLFVNRIPLYCSRFSQTSKLLLMDILSAGAKSNWLVDNNISYTVERHIIYG
jgi:hypothetical protein